MQVLRAPVGGLFRHVYDLTQELARRGHQVGVVADSLTSDALTGQRLRELAPSIALGTYYFPMPRTVGVGDVTTPLRVRRLANTLKIDVLHGHGAKGGVHARLSRLGRGDRVALNTPHGGVLNYKPGTLVGGFFRSIEHAIGAITDAYIFESAFAQRRFHEMIGRPPCAEEVIHNGLAPEEFDPLPCDPDAHDFVYVGEFRGAKGIGYLIEALVEVKAADGRPATMAMAGGGPEFEQTKARIAELGLTDRIELLGVRPVRQALNRGHCLVVASLDAEIHQRSGGGDGGGQGTARLHPSALFDRAHGRPDRGALLRNAGETPRLTARLNKAVMVNHDRRFSLGLHAFLPIFESS